MNRAVLANCQAKTAYLTHLSAAQRTAVVLRVNPQTHWAESSGEAKQRKAIRLEIAKSKAATHANE